ncbi:hypothetical protein ACLBKW_01200 [Bacillus altitudinis]|uniref:hypothetical protein n=1 Tax=Bacillus TaxID=1386 RepID=UPI00124579D8|nr:hypothetical protein [Bacillus safensis]WEZ16506.1 hypothetical protein P5638_01880 [Bacillus safensis]
MGNFAHVEIRDFSDAESVITPVIQVSKNEKAPTLDQMIDNINELFEHQKFYARCTCDVNAHL